MKVEIRYSIFEIKSELSCNLKSCHAVSGLYQPLPFFSPSFIPLTSRGVEERILFDASLRRTRSSGREKVEKRIKELTNASL
jgi:hypothetical protein